MSHINGVHVQGDLMDFFSVLNQFKQFQDMLQRSGRDPKKLLDELVESGKYNQSQIENAKSMASMFANLLGGRK